jgi:hypothetical protein
MGIYGLWTCSSHAIQVSDSRCELGALFSFEKQLCYLLASALIFYCRDCFILFLILILVVNRPEAVFWISSLVLCFCVLCLDFPNTLLFQGKGSPAVA